MIRGRFAHAVMFTLALALPVSGAAQAVKMPDATARDSTYGEGGTKTLSSETRADGVRIENIDYKDKNGKLRERHHRTISKNGESVSNDEWWDANGQKTKESGRTQDKDGFDTSKTSATYENGKQVTGDSWEKRPDGIWDHQRFNPETGKYEPVDSEDIVNNFYIGAGFVFEDSFHRFLTKGVEASYTHALSLGAGSPSRFGIMGDFEWTGGTSDEVTYSKVQGLGGLAFAGGRSGKMFWGFHALAGFARVSSHSSVNPEIPSYTGTAFAIAAGVDAGTKVNEKIDVQVRVDFNPTIRSGYVSKNIRLSGGLRYRF